MTTIKKTTLVPLLFIANNASAQQQLYLEAGKSSTTYGCKNPKGIKLDNLQATASSSMTIGYRNQVFPENLSRSFGADYSVFLPNKPMKLSLSLLRKVLK